MSTITHSKTITSLMISFRVHHSPRRVLQSRQDNVGVLINLHLEVHFLLWEVEKIFETFTTFRGTDNMKRKACPKLKNLRKIKSSVTNRT